MFHHLGKGALWFMAAHIVYEKSDFQSLNQLMVDRTRTWLEIPPKKSQNLTPPPPTTEEAFILACDFQVVLEEKGYSFTLFGEKLIENTNDSQISN